MISIVNGYVCTSSCDEAKAKHGKDPSAPVGSPPGASGKDDKKSAFAGQPASILDGALKDLAGANAVTPAENTQAPRLDRLA